jgi:hypothetical protein
MLRSDFRALIVLRIPISALALAGLDFLIYEYSTGKITALVYPGLLVYLGVVSVQLFRLRPGAIAYAWVLVLLEAVGAVLWVGLRDLRLGQHLGALAILGCIVVIVWGLLNGLLFYKARGLFVKDAVPKK